MNTLYDYNDKVSFLLDGKDFVGIIKIIDRFGCFFDDSEPYYDIYVQNCNLLIKHVPQSAIKKVG